MNRLLSQKFYKSECLLYKGELSLSVRHSASVTVFKAHEYSFINYLGYLLQLWTPSILEIQTEPLKTVV